ncbi:MAG: hypothetical protein AAFP68_04570 [Pseudomonadota bacterium]
MPNKLIAIILVVSGMASPAAAHLTADAAHNGGHGWTLAALAGLVVVLVGAGVAWLRGRS